MTFSLPDAIAPVDLGDFDPATADCTLDSDGILGTFTSSCQVTYTPSAKGDGTHTIAASYEGSDVHAASADTDGVSVTVDHRATTTSVVCVPATIDAGETTTCTVTVTDASLAGTASDPLGTVTFTSDSTDGTFDPDATCTLVGNGDNTSDCVVDSDVASAAAAGTHNIDATYAPDGSDLDVHAASGTQDAFALTITTSADLSVSKDDGVSTVTAGLSIGTYTITVSNAGPSDAVNVSLDDTFPAGFSLGTITPDQGTCSGGPDLTCDLLTIAADESVVVTVDYTIPSSTTASPQTNSATVDSDVDDPDTSNNTATDSDDVATSADLSISKSAPVATAVAGTDLTYTILVSNAGPSDAQNASVADTLPAGTTYVSSAAGCSFLTPTVTCTATTIASGGSATFTITVHIAASVAHGSSLANTATVSSDTSDFNGANDSSTATVTVNRQADLAVTKADSADPVTVGDEFSYAITVTNNGPSDSGAFTVTDPLPIEVSVVNPGTCTEAPVGTVTCSGSSLAAGASVIYSITVSADQAGAPINTASITAAATNDPNTVNNSGSAQTTIQPGSLFSDVATGDPDWQNQIDGVDVMFKKSGTSTYTLKATNPGTFKYRLSLENETGIDIHVKGKQLPNDHPARRRRSRTPTAARRPST